MTISAVGSPVAYYNYTSNTSLAVNPTAVGDVLVVSTIVTASATNRITSLSCPKVSEWTHLAGPFNGTTGFGTPFGNLDFWLGEVAETGPSAITFAGAQDIGPASFALCSYICQQFHSSVPGVAWGIESAASNNPGKGSVVRSYSTLTPSGSGQMYWGMSSGDGVASTSGQTSGYKLIVPSGFSVGTSGLFNPNVSTAQTPSAHQNSAGKFLTAGVLIKATA